MNVGSTNNKYTVETPLPSTFGDVILFVQEIKKSSDKWINSSDTPVIDLVEYNLDTGIKTLGNALGTGVETLGNALEDGVEIVTDTARGLVRGFKGFAKGFLTGYKSK